MAFFKKIMSVSQNAAQPILVDKGELFLEKLKDLSGILIGRVSRKLAERFGPADIENYCPRVLNALELYINYNLRLPWAQGVKPEIITSEQLGAFIERVRPEEAAEVKRSQESWDHYLDRIVTRLRIVREALDDEQIVQWTGKTRGDEMILISYAVNFLTPARKSPESFLSIGG